MLPAIPFTDGATLSAALLVGAAVLAGWFAADAALRRGAALFVATTIAYLLPLEVPAVAQVVGWCVLAIMLLNAERRDAPGAPAYRVAALLFTGLAGLVASVRVAPPDRLAVHAGAVVIHLPFVSGATLAFAAVAATCAVAARRYRDEPQVVRWLTAASVVAVVYLLSVGTVDLFAARANADRETLRDLQWGAQVALSALWATLGGVAFAAGVLRHTVVARVSGLALLAVATAKVFVYDLATLDATYRVLSLAALGVLLLISSYLYQRQGRRAGASGGASPL